jgi:hypothetical protein
MPLLPLLEAQVSLSSSDKEEEVEQELEEKGPPRPTYMTSTATFKGKFTIQISSAAPKKTLPAPIPTRKSACTPKLPGYYKQLTKEAGTSTFSQPDFDRERETSIIDVSFINHTFLTDISLATNSSIIDIKDPKTLKEACTCPDWPKWQEAMNKEMGTLLKAGT